MYVSSTHGGISQKTMCDPIAFSFDEAGNLYASQLRDRPRPPR